MADHDRVAKAINDALRLVGHRADIYDADAVIGRLLEHGIHVIDSDQVMTGMFDDRCDFECTTCHPEEGDS